MPILQACKASKSYQGIRQPRCNGGRGCLACWTIWKAKRKRLRPKGVKV